MSHNHTIIDTGKYFVIDPLLRTITTETSELVLSQGDHNSERYTFEIPRLVEGHDMSFCNRIEVHYDNISKNKKEVNEDFYIVTDATVNGDYLRFSWLISENATGLAGTVQFWINFICADENNEIIYSWGTGVFKGVRVLANNRNINKVVANFPDVLGLWKTEVTDAIDEEKQSAIKEIDTKANEVLEDLGSFGGGSTDDIYTLNEGETIENAPEEAVIVVDPFTDPESVPDSGGNVDQVSVEPAYEDIPKIFFGGALQQTKDEKVVPFRYISKTDDFSGYAEIKAQGNSSMSYPKKNQTVKMFADEASETKMKKDFKGWGKQNKHVYKANWIDITHARNVVSARLWGDVVKSRANYAELPELLRTSPNQGAVDGFPVKVYAAGVYQGRYTLNIPKDAWMANMDKDLDTHCILCGENYVSGCFRASANINESDWTDEIHDTVPASIKTRWNQVISFVMNSTDDEFRANLNQYFYVDSLIDYYLFGLASCGLDAFGKNQLYMTYDGQKWIATMYDMDSTWGLYWNGSKFVSSSYGRDEYEDYVNSTGNLLYVRLEQLFYEELQTRWAELRNGALSIDNIINRFERFTDIAPAELVKEDYSSTTGGGKFTGIPSQTTNNIQQIRAFALARQVWTDEYVAGLTGGGEEPDTPDVPEKILTSISAIYSGGDVFVGTEVTALSGVTVTAHYSDGTEAVVTGYTLSGEIAEGANTITVSYGGKTTTFTVTGKIKKIVINNLVALSEVNDDTCDQASGAFNPDAVHNSSGFIPVKPGDNIEFNGVSAAYFDADKNYVSGIPYSGTVPKTVTVPDGVAFICFNYNANLKPYLIILPIKEADIAIGEELATSANIDTTGNYSEDGFNTNDTYGTLKPTNVSPGMVFTISNCDTAAFYSKDMVWVASSNARNSVTVPNQAVYMTVSFNKTKELSVIRTA